MRLACAARCLAASKPSARLSLRHRRARCAGSTLTSCGRRCRQRRRCWRCWASWTWSRWGCAACDAAAPPATSPCPAATCRTVPDQGPGGSECALLAPAVQVTFVGEAEGVAMAGQKGQIELVVGEGVEVFLPMAGLFDAGAWAGGAGKVGSGGSGCDGRHGMAAGSRPDARPRPCPAHGALLQPRRLSGCRSSRTRLRRSWRGCRCAPAAPRRCAAYQVCMMLCRAERPPTHPPTHPSYPAHTQTGTAV